MRKCLILHAALLLAIAVLVGCGDRKDAGAGKTITLGLSYDSLESAWLVVNHRAVTEEAQRRGAKVISVMAEGDAAKQNVQIENLLARQVDAIICFPKDSAAIVKSIKNEIDIMEDESGCVVIEEYSFEENDLEGLQTAVDFLNAVEHWTVCPCGEYLIKDALAPGADMCYYCDMTTPEGGETVFCPICHESGNVRWMVATACCKQRMHRKCREACIRHDDPPRCPMCRSSWAA